ncbi:hypothetical protein ROZALSC1DRAFT_29918 [Rozella allomycis CSF55]|uniref:Uncharacterized protein n=1 Tax=Rozella allomycis (strain CSF55) TaxID=988480 RepID=A0A075AN65_ROZAC|nr:hypothetical protein O9G_005740 [Rozella allomycis CSF55]RKP18393.1 hypothetical protein ROZALSC1DRAFT_29918 [Rozella allomycis CSF55]|eukprot:EPZ31217.1 hypothetical protein O9G_005740 [Rozella allomycis CSF55]
MKKITPLSRLQCPLLQMKSLIFFSILLISIICFDIKQYIRDDKVEKVVELVDNASYYEKRRYLTAKVLSSCFRNPSEAKIEIFNYLLKSVDKIGKLDVILTENNFQLLYDLMKMTLTSKECTSLCRISVTLANLFASSQSVRKGLSEVVLRTTKGDLSVDNVGYLVMPILRSIHKCNKLNIEIRFFGGFLTKLVEENWFLMMQNIIEEEKNSEFVHAMIEFTEKEKEMIDEKFARTLIESKHRNFYMLHLLKIVEYFSLEERFVTVLGVPELRKAVEEDEFEEFDKIQRLVKRMRIEKHVASFDNYILIREASRKEILDFFKILVEWDYVNSLASEKYEIIKNAFNDKRLLNYVCENSSLPTIIMKSQISKENKVFQFLLENCQVNDMALGNIMDLIIKNNDRTIYEIFKSVEAGKRFINENFHTYILMSASKEKIMFFYDLFIIKMHLPFTILESDFQVSLNKAIIKSDDPLSLLGIVSKFYGLKIYPIFFNYDNYNLVYSHILTSEGDLVLKTWFINVVCQKEETINDFIFSINFDKASILHEFMVDQKYYRYIETLPLYVRILLMDRKGFEYLFHKDNLFFMEFYQSTFKNHLDNAMSSINKLRNEENVYEWVMDYSRNFKNYLSYHTLKAFAEISSHIHNDNDFNSQIADILQSHWGIINQDVKYIAELLKQETPTEENSSYYPPIVQRFKVGPEGDEKQIIDYEIKYLANVVENPLSFWRQLYHLNRIYSALIVVDELVYFIKYNDFIKENFLVMWIERLAEVYPQLKSEIVKSKNFLSLLKSENISLVLNFIYSHLFTDFYELRLSSNLADDCGDPFIYEYWVHLIRMYHFKPPHKLYLFADMIFLRYPLCSQGNFKEFLTFTISRMRAALFILEYEFSKFNLIHAIENIENSLTSINLKFHPFFKRVLNLNDADNFSYILTVILKIDFFQKIDQNIIEPKVYSPKQIVYSCHFHKDFHVYFRDFTLVGKHYTADDLGLDLHFFLNDQRCKFDRAILERPPNIFTYFFTKWLPETW